MSIPAEAPIDATLPTEPSRAEAAGRERLWFALAGVTLVALGGGFWFVNGARTFGELMLGAFSWCF